MVDVRQIALDTLAQGAAPELFRDALAKVLANIDDPNTDWKTRRGITLTFAFSTNEERRMGEVAVGVKTTLAGVKGVRRPVFFGRHEGHLVAVEQPSQREMFGPPEGKPRLVDKETGEVKEEATA